MNQREMDGWVNLDFDDRGGAVGIPTLLAYGDWLHRIDTPHELHDVGPWAPTGWVPREVAASAAATAAAELAVVCLIWPGSIDVALRPVTLR